MAGNQNFTDGNFSSKVGRRQAAEADRRRKLEQEQAQSLRPGVEHILEWIDEEKAAVTDLEQMAVDLDPTRIREMIPLARQLDVSNATLLQAQTLARLMHVQWLDGVKARAKAAVRVADRLDKAAAKATDKAIAKELEDGDA